MRVLLTTDTVGGVWTFTKELAVGLLERKHCVVLVSLGRAPSNSQHAWVSRLCQHYGAAFRFEASDAPLEWTENNKRAYSDAEGLLLRVVDEFEAELVHANQFCFGALPVDLPKILTAHSDVLSWAEVCRPDGLQGSEWLQTYRGLVDAGIAGADLVVTPTRWMRDALMRHFPTCAQPRVVWNGLTLSKAGSDVPRSLRAITVGRLWDEAKGLEILAGVVTCMPMLVVGEARFESSQAPELKNVKLLGSLKEEQVLDVLRGSALYLATSIYEPFGMAPLEAALCGCGLVARDIASLREVWGNAAEYFTDSRELSGLMLRLRDSPEELESLRHRSIERASHLSAARMVDAYVENYKELLGTLSTPEEAVAYVG